MKAYKLLNIANGLCGFEEGTIPGMTHLPATYFFSQTHIDTYEKHPHPAPRYQFVITLKGKLKFTVSDGSQFIIQPGVILIAEDVSGKGHTWELIEGDEWHRIYIVPPPNAPDYFLADNS
jgi:hypothetical protein